MKVIVGQLAVKLNERRKRLGFSCSALAQRSGVSLRTVQRVLSGKEVDPGMGTVGALIEALGLELQISAKEEARDTRHRQAQRKAERLVAMVQGTSALEAQGLSAGAIRDLRERTIHELLAGSNRKLWAE